MRLHILFLLAVLTVSTAFGQPATERKLPRQAGSYDFTEYINALSNFNTDCDRMAHMEVPCLKKDVRSRLREAADQFEFEDNSQLQHYIFEFTVDPSGKLSRIFFYDENGLTEMDQIKEFLLNMESIPRKQLAGDSNKVSLASFGVVDYLLVKKGRLVVPD